MCTCATHCAESSYHERACCSETRCGCACHLLTADTITDDDIRELRRVAVMTGDGTTAWFCWAALGGDGARTTTDTHAARARCAETLNARRSS